MRNTLLATAILLPLPVPVAAQAAPKLQYQADEYSPGVVSMALYNGISCQDTVEVSVRGSRRLRVEGPPCGFVTSRKRIASRTTAEIERGYADDDGYPAVILTVKTKIRRQKFRTRTRYMVRVNGRLWERGTITTWLRPIPRRQIRQGTDAFVNICINENKTITSENGDLVCYVGGYTEVTTRVVGNGRVRREVVGHEY